MTQTFMGTRRDGRMFIMVHGLFFLNIFYIPEKLENPEIWATSKAKLAGYLPRYLPWRVVGCAVCVEYMLDFCISCGFAHALNDMETCDKNIDKISTRSGRKAGNI